MSTLPRGICPICGQDRQLTKAGVMRYHRAPRKDILYAGWDCKGIGQPPTSVVADPLTTAEERGYARAIADLRTRAGQLTAHDAEYARSYADYLESIAPGRTTP